MPWPCRPLGPLDGGWQTCGAVLASFFSPRGWADACWQCTAMGAPAAGCPSGNRLLPGVGGHCPPALILFLEKQHKNKVISRHLQTWMCVVGTSEGRCWAASPNLPVCCGAAAGAVFWCRSEWVGGCRGLNPSTPPYQARSVCITLVSPLQITSQAEPRRLCVSKRPEK